MHHYKFVVTFSIIVSHREEQKLELDAHRKEKWNECREETNTSSSKLDCRYLVLIISSSLESSRITKEVQQDYYFRLHTHGKILELLYCSNTLYIHSQV